MFFAAGMRSLPSMGSLRWLTIVSELRFAYENCKWAGTHGRSKLCGAYVKLLGTSGNRRCSIFRDAA